MTENSHVNKSTSLGELIKKRRTELGLTLEDVGKAIGVGRSCVLKYEKGTVKTIKASKVLALAERLQISPISILMAVEKSEREG